MYRSLICWKNFKSKILIAATNLFNYLEPTILNVVTVSFSHSRNPPPRTSRPLVMQKRTSLSGCYSKREFLDDTSFCRRNLCDTTSLYEINGEQQARLKTELWICVLGLFFSNINQATVYPIFRVYVSIASQISEYHLVGFRPLSSVCN
jgi:hypothetical protein